MILRGTEFRIWATNVLRNHIVKGYTVNTRRLKDLSQAVRLIADTALVAMTLLIAESKPSEKDLLCRVLVHLIVRGD